MLNIKPNTWVKIKKLTPEGPIIVPRLVVQSHNEFPHGYAIIIDDSLEPFDEKPRMIHEDEILEVMPPEWMPGL
jgi:hypothetical protein